MKILSWIKNGVDILQYITSMQKQKDEEKNSEAKVFIAKLREACEEIFLVEDPLGENAIRLNSRYKILYEQSSYVLGETAYSKYLNLCMEIISNARIYLKFKIYKVYGKKKLQNEYDSIFRCSNSGKALNSLICHLLMYEENEFSDKDLEVVEADLIKKIEDITKIFV